MADVVVFHNPRCSNSRTALQLLGARGDQVEVIEYLKAPLDRAAVVELLFEYPELMQRPVLVSGGRAIIARPPAETVPAFLG
jgi:arsenate reductase